MKRILLISFIICLLPYTKSNASAYKIKENDGAYYYMVDNEYTKAPATKWYKYKGNYYHIRKGNIGADYIYLNKQLKKYNGKRYVKYTGLIKNENNVLYYIKKGKAAGYKKTTWVKYNGIMYHFTKNKPYADFVYNKNILRRYRNGKYVRYSGTYKLYDNKTYRFKKGIIKGEDKEGWTKSDNNYYYYKKGSISPLYKYENKTMYVYKNGRYIVYTGTYALPKNKKLYNFINGKITICDEDFWEQGTYYFSKGTNYVSYILESGQLKKYKDGRYQASNESILLKDRYFSQGKTYTGVHEGVNYINSTRLATVGWKEDDSGKCYYFNKLPTAAYYYIMGSPLVYRVKTGEQITDTKKIGGLQVVDGMLYTGVINTNYSYDYYENGKITNVDSDRYINYNNNLYYFEKGKSAATYKIATTGEDKYIYDMHTYMPPTLHKKAITLNIDGKEVKFNNGSTAIMLYREYEAKRYEDDVFPDKENLNEYLSTCKEYILTDESHIYRKEQANGSYTWCDEAGEMYGHLIIYYSGYSVYTDINGREVYRVDENGNCLYWNGIYYEQIDMPEYFYVGDGVKFPNSKEVIRNE